MGAPWFGSLHKSLAHKRFAVQIFEGAKIVKNLNMYCWLARFSAARGLRTRYGLQVFSLTSALLLLENKRLGKF